MEQWEGNEAGVVGRSQVRVRTTVGSCGKVLGEESRGDLSSWSGTWKEREQDRRLGTGHLRADVGGVLWREVEGIETFKRWSHWVLAEELTGIFFSPQNLWLALAGV